MLNFIIRLAIALLIYQSVLPVRAADQLLEPAQIKIVFLQGSQGLISNLTDLPIPTQLDQFVYNEAHKEDIIKVGLGGNLLRFDLYQLLLPSQKLIDWHKSYVASFDAFFIDFSDLLYTSNAGLSKIEHSISKISYSAHSQPIYIEKFDSQALKLLKIANNAHSTDERPSGVFSIALVEDKLLAKKQNLAHHAISSDVGLFQFILEHDDFDLYIATNADKHLPTGANLSYYRGKPYFAVSRQDQRQLLLTIDIEQNGYSIKHEWLYLPKITSINPMESELSEQLKRKLAWKFVSKSASAGEMRACYQSIIKNVYEQLGKSFNDELIIFSDRVQTQYFEYGQALTMRNLLLMIKMFTPLASIKLAPQNLELLRPILATKSEYDYWYGSVPRQTIISSINNIVFDQRLKPILMHTKKDYDYTEINFGLMLLHYIESNRPPAQCLKIFAM